MAYNSATKQGYLVKTLINRFNGLQALKIKVNSLDETSKILFLQDFAYASEDVLKTLNADPNLVDSWKVLGDAGVDDAIRKNPLRVQQVDNYLKKNPGTEEAIKQGLNDVGDYKEEFLNGIKNATEDLIHLNGRSALPDEIADAVTKIKQHRTDVGNLKQGNYGYLEGNLGDVTPDGVPVRSGAPDTDIPEIFEAKKVNSQNEVDGIGAWNRTTDSEYKMLNRLANEYGAVKGGVYPEATGTLKIVSEIPYCPSCQGVIQEFHTMFPNVNLILVDGVR